jgi:hypothetical protein
MISEIYYQRWMILTDFPVLVCSVSPSSWVFENALPKDIFFGSMSHRSVAYLVFISDEMTLSIDPCKFRSLSFLAFITNLSLFTAQRPPSNAPRGPPSLRPPPGFPTVPSSPSPQPLLDPALADDCLCPRLPFLHQTGLSLPLPDCYTVNTYNL